MVIPVVIVWERILLKGYRPSCHGATNGVGHGNSVITICCHHHRIAVSIGHSDRTADRKTGTGVIFPVAVHNLDDPAGAGGIIDVGRGRDRHIGAAVSHIGLSNVGGTTIGQLHIKAIDPATVSYVKGTTQRPVGIAYGVCTVDDRYIITAIANRCRIIARASVTAVCQLGTAVKREGRRIDDKTAVSERHIDIGAGGGRRGIIGIIRNRS